MIKRATVIGAGPAGLMAAERLAQAGLSVTVYEAKPSPARKFLMAGKSGLNLTFDGDMTKVLSGYGDRAKYLQRIIQAFDNHALMHWAECLGAELIIGSTGRVFPRVMKASPLLRAWLKRLDDLGVRLLTRHRWIGWDAGHPVIETSDGVRLVAQSNVTVLACGGASWARLGSDGSWADFLGVQTAPFKPSNSGVTVPWSRFMARHFGAPIKNVLWTSGPYRSQGEAVLSQTGLEGGGIYSVSNGVREGNDLIVDLLPRQLTSQVADRLGRPRGKSSLSNHLRKVLKLTPAKVALLQECARPLPDGPDDLAEVLKALVIPRSGLRPLDEAISSAGGVPFAQLDEGLMMKSRPGVFCAGEMLDWEAPTGGWLLTGCFATGAWAGTCAAYFANNQVSRNS